MKVRYSVKSKQGYKECVEVLKVMMVLIQKILMMMMIGSKTEKIDIIPIYWIWLILHRILFILKRCNVASVVHV